MKNEENTEPGPQSFRIRKFSRSLSRHSSLNSERSNKEGQDDNNHTIESPENDKGKQDSINVDEITIKKPLPK